jgi:glycosyltransferase involved in cell wall biosynthesis
MITKNMQKICIVAPSYISSTPRVVKEADALHGAGFDVRVVFSQGQLEQLRNHDQQLLLTKKWDYDILGWSCFRPEEKSIYNTTKIRHYLMRSLPNSLYNFGKFAEYGEGRIYPELAKLAAAKPADLYIGHYPTGLAAAAFAAQKWGAKLGYDFEDFYIAEQPQTKVGIKTTERIKIIENRYVKHCDYLSAVSDPIAEELTKIYPIKKPLVIHNVFPLSERNNLDGQIKDRQGKAISLYWYSQVIGEGRGLEEAIKAVGLLTEKLQLHLRGSITEETQEKFISLAQENHVENIYFHPQVSSTELLSRTVEHDIGFALEQPVSLNRLLTVTNKMFFYMVGGLAIAATDVPGQRSIMEKSPNIGVLYPPGDYQNLASQLNKLVTDSDYLNQCKQASLNAALNQWNWELEGQKIVRNLQDLNL